MLQFRMINLLILAMTIANFALAESNTGPFEIQLSSDEISSKKLNHAIKNIPDRMAETARATKSYFDLQGEDFEGQNCFWFALSHHMPELSTKKLSIDFSNLVIEKDGIELSHIKFPGYDNFETVHRESHGPEKENEQELSFPWIMIPGVNLENEEFFIQVQNPQEIKLGDLFVVFFISSSFEPRPLENPFENFSSSRRDGDLHVHIKQKQAVHMGLMITNSFMIQKDNPTSKNFSFTSINSQLDYWTSFESQNLEIHSKILRPRAAFFEQIKAQLKSIP